MPTPGTLLYPTALDTVVSLFETTNRATTTLTIAPSSGDTTLTVASTSLFPSTGAITIDNEIIYYTGKTSTTFTGCIRGSGGTSAASHANSAAVDGHVISSHHSILSSAVIAVQTKVGYGASNQTPTTVGNVLTVTAAGQTNWSAPGAGAWGTITGTLSSQTDLQAALNAKQNTGNYITSLTGDVTASGSGAAAATIANNAVTLAKMATMATNKLLGRSTAGTGIPEIISIGSGLTLSGGTLSSSSSGTVTTTGTPANGNLTKFSGAASITNGDLSGDISTSGSLVTTLSQSISPTMTGVWIFTPAARTSGSAPYFTINIPTDTGITTGTEAIGFKTVTATRTWAGTTTLSTQRENVFAAPTYSFAGTTTVGTVATVAITGAPIVGSNVSGSAFANPYALWVQSGASRYDALSTAAITATANAVQLTPTVMRIVDGSDGTPSSSTSPALTVGSVKNGAYVGGVGMASFLGTSAGGNSIEVVSITGTQNAAITDAGGIAGLYIRVNGSASGTNQSNFALATNVQRNFRVDSTEYEANPSNTYNRAVNGATNVNPIVITTTAAHDMNSGDTAVISGVGGNTAANGTWIITNLSANTFSIPIAGNGAYTSGGIVGLHASPNYAGGAGNRVTGLAIFSSGNAPVTAGIVIGNTVGTVPYYTPIDIQTGAIYSGTNRAIRIPNVSRLESLTAAGSSQFALISGNASDKVLIDADGKGTVFGGTIATTSPSITTGIKDSNGNPIIDFIATASAVNRLQVTNAATGGTVDIAPVGSDSAINTSITNKGNGSTIIKTLGDGATLSALAITNTGTSLNTGTGLLFKFGTGVNIGGVSAVTTDVTGGAEKSDIFFRTVNAGTLTEWLRIKSYGTTEFSGPAKLKSYVVSALPSASTTGAGSMAYVTDATLTTITGLGLAVTGGGANKVVVVSDGTNWIIL